MIDDHKPFQDHFSAHAADYASARPTYPPRLFEWLAEQCEERQLAWDVATGNGQAAMSLAEHFEKVLASDGSAAQLEAAQRHPSINYQQAVAGDPWLPGDCVDLVTVAQAVHWFDQERFFADAMRVLKPGGVLAVWGYGRVEVSPNIDRIEEVFYKDVVGDYWPPERSQLDAELSELEMPGESIEVPDFEMSVTWTARQFINYIGTWSAVRRYRDAKGHDPLVWLQGELDPFWRSHERRRVRWPLFLKVSRKPES
ncbi:MAG: class I SAM-dependent methyltransferase [Gammaproteobacteria bacterium]|nr:class I SAM-dependent methyltransferase [Gammaproteobacteria bacterium]